MRIYISGAISSDPNYKNKFARAQQELEANGYKVVNPARVDEVMPGASWEEYMTIDMELLAICDAVYMLRDWTESRGAVCEYKLAKELELQVLFEGVGTLTI